MRQTPAAPPPLHVSMKPLSQRPALSTESGELWHRQANDLLSRQGLAPPRPVRVLRCYSRTSRPSGEDANLPRRNGRAAVSKVQEEQIGPRVSFPRNALPRPDLPHTKRQHRYRPGLADSHVPHALQRESKSARSPRAFKLRAREMKSPPPSCGTKMKSGMMQ